MVERTLIEKMKMKTIYDKECIVKQYFRMRVLLYYTVGWPRQTVTIRVESQQNKLSGFVGRALFVGRDYAIGKRWSSTCCTRSCVITPHNKERLNRALRTPVPNLTVRPSLRDDQKSVTTRRR